MGNIRGHSRELVGSSQENVPSYSQLFATYAVKCWMLSGSRARPGSGKHTAGMIGGLLRSSDLKGRSGEEGGAARCQAGHGDKGY